MKRLLVVPIVVMFLMTAFVPASSADASVVFLGQAQSDALKVAVPLLNNLPLVGGLLSTTSLGNLTGGITVGHTENTFEGLSPAPQAKGLAIGVCALLGHALMSLPAVSGALPGSLPSLPAVPTLGSLPCTGADQIISDSTGAQGDTTQHCGTDLAIAILDLKTACAQSFSSVANGRPIGENNAGVAELHLSLLSNVLGTGGLSSLLGSLGGGLVNGLPVVGPIVSNTVGGTLTGLVPGLLGPLLGQQNGSGGVLGGTQATDLLSSVTNLLQGALGNLGDLLTIKLGQGSTVITNNGAATQDTAHAAGATIGLLANLIQVTVGESTSQVTWNDTTGSASAHASPALAHLTIGNPLGGTLLDLPIDLSGLTNGLGSTLGGLGVVSTDAQHDLILLKGTPLQTTIGISTATDDATGPSVSASSSALTVKALQGLGASSPTAFDGGIIVDLASTSASVAGNIAKVQSASSPLPITGGRDYVFLAGAGILALGAAQMLRGSRKVRANAKA